MKITIVYESMFGNTHEVAQAISDGVREADPDADVGCVPVGKASPELIKSADLLVVGGPTHIRGMTSGFSRKMGISGEHKAEVKGEASHDLEPDAEGPGLREWFDGLPKVDGGQAAAFDTRLGSSMAGGAARGIARRLRKHGYNLLNDPEGFVVEDAHGPLRAGEVERAKQWGAELVQARTSAVTQPVSSASNEGKTPAVPTAWPRDLTDLLAMQPFGSTGWWPFRDIETEEFIKVEEFIDGDHLVIRAELPGVEPDRDIDVWVDDGVLTIAAERQESSRKKLDKGGYRSEFRYGSFMRQVRLPTGTPAEVVSAAYKDGVLEIRMPKPGEAASRRIQIQRA
jgi:HSP20 family molecular chaperone IbpA